MKKKDVERLESENTKICTKCKQVKPLYEFSVSSTGRKFSKSECIECTKERSKESHILNKFNITLETYDKMLKKQNGKCKICGSKETGCKSKGRFYIDHDHKTDKIRGLLCNHCNHMLGHAKDDIETLAKAITYLSRSKQ